MRDKFELCKALKIWKELVETKTSFKVNKPHLDSYGEYEDF